MIEVAFESMGGIARVKIAGKEITCKGSFDNYQREYPIEQLISLAVNKNQEKLQKDLDDHYKMMDSLSEEEDVYEYIVSEFKHQGFQIIGEVRNDG
tara:strand:+ start:237 stop:524 length:288 start_codon:yes stop_codon:yes gene_type:complete